MKNEEIHQQLEELRHEVRALKTSINTLRQDDLREVYGEQIKPILIERIERFPSKQLDDLPDEVKTKFKLMLIRYVEEVVEAFQTQGKGAALTALESSERELRNSIRPIDVSRSKFVSELTQQIRDYLEVSDRVFSQTFSISPLPQSTNADSLSSRPPSSSIEKVLGPLSNAWRIDLLNLLMRGDESLASLSKALVIKKGHLQFHLRSLTDSGLIQYDKKSRQYTITERGAFALEGITKLVERLLKT